MNPSINGGVDVNKAGRTLSSRFPAGWKRDGVAQHEIVRGLDLGDGVAVRGTPEDHGRCLVLPSSFG